MKVLKTTLQNLETAINMNEKELAGACEGVSDRTINVSWQEMLFICSSIQDVVDNGIMMDVHLIEKCPQVDVTDPVVVPAAKWLPRKFVDLPPTQVTSDDKFDVLSNIMRWGNDAYDMYFRGYKLVVV